VRGLFVGRFQPFHRGHLAVVRQVLRERPEADLLLAIGSAEQSFTWENPFTAGERFEMIERALREAGLGRVAIVPVADIQRHAQWVRYLEALLPAFDRVYSHNRLTELLFARAGYRVDRPAYVERRRFEGVRIRRALARGRAWRAAVPPAVARYLVAIDAPARLRLLEEAGAGTPRAQGGP
jgi:nicotinamide-nucleotide adenylyltransferase